MPPKRWSDRPADGIDRSPWRNLWEGCQRQLKEQGTWQEQQKPLLDQYVFAVKEALEHRALADEQPTAEHADGRVYLHPGFASADRAVKRAASLADLLGLTPKARKALGLLDLDDDADDQDDQPSALDAQPVSLDELRARRTG